MRVVCCDPQWRSWCRPTPRSWPAGVPSPTSLDKLLDSGLYTGEITELSGGPGSGKSQVCFGVAANVSLRLKQGVVFIDTTGGFTAKRLLQMIQDETEDGREQMEALQRIRVFRPLDVFALLDCLYGLRGGELQQASGAGGGGGSVKVLIVDSVSAVISPVLGGKQSEGMSLMTQVASVLKTTAKDFNVSVLVTNHVTWGGGGGGGGELQPGLGASWSHVPRPRILLERVGPSSQRRATLIKSSRRPCHMTEELDLQRGRRPSAKRRLEET
ncbi:DNA repair protein RAD51 homolog 4 isoform X2 [Antennarius striatus]|uniref:DNA repair protein RAD51 homolog 4 isoform X2 n=1 Tax=Antennarius striatus TaxID=241820 RepID=UPI0035B301AF